MFDCGVDYFRAELDEREREARENRQSDLGKPGLPVHLAKTQKNIVVEKTFLFCRIAREQGTSFDAP